jgi:hypothetical protein
MGEERLGAALQVMELLEGFFVFLGIIFLKKMNAPFVAENKCLPV